MNFKDYYQALGVEPAATAKEIKQAYRKLAHQYHPDISKDPQAEKKFKEIGEAYATLKDAEKRQAYDDLGRRPAGEPFTPPPDWGRQFNVGEGGFDNVDFSDLFAAFGRHRKNAPQAGQDYELVAPISLEQIYRGEQIEISAELPEFDQSGLPHRVAHTFRITIPQGAADKQRLRLTGKGEAGFNGGRAGDLYVALALQAHPLYRVNDRDLYIDLPLTPWEAVLGKTIQLPTLAGPVDLNIKPGTVAGQKLRLAKRGLAGVNGNTGALYAVINIDVAKDVSVAEHELFEKLAAVSDFNPRKHFGLASGAEK